MALVALAFLFLSCRQIKFQQHIFINLFAFCIALSFIIFPNFNNQKSGKLGPLEKLVINVIGIYPGSNKQFTDYLAHVEYNGLNDFYHDGNYYFLFNKQNQSNKILGKFFDFDKVHVLRNVSTQPVYAKKINCDDIKIKKSKARGWNIIEPIKMNFDGSVSGPIKLNFCYGYDKNNCKILKDFIVDMSKEYIFQEESVEISILFRYGHVKRVPEGQYIFIKSKNAACKLDKSKFKKLY